MLHIFQGDRYIRQHEGNSFEALFSLASFFRSYCEWRSIRYVPCLVFGHSADTSTSFSVFCAFCCTRLCGDVTDFHFVYSTEKCDSPLGLPLPDNKWSASSTSDGSKFAAHFGRMNYSPDTVGWCSSTAKEEKAFIEVTPWFIVLFVSDIKIDLVTPPRDQSNQGSNGG